MFAMKSFLSLVLFFTLILGCYSAVYFERQRTVPGHEKQCHDKTDDVFYNRGEEMKWKRKECGRKVCLGSSGKEYTFVEIQTCGKISAPPECHVEVSLELAYPFCCERIICPNARDSNAIVT